MLRRPAVGRGRPGLLGTMARTAVVAGTATAVAGGVRGAQNRKAQEAAEQQAAQQAVTEQQQQLAQMQQQVDQMQAPAAPAPASSPDLITELKKLADLHSAGVLTDDEFAAAKARLLGS